MSGRDSARARTRLSWQRTGLGLVVLGLLLLRQGLTRNSWPEWTAGLLAIACAVACASPALRGRRSTADARSAPLLLTGCVLVVCALACAGVLVG